VTTRHRVVLLPGAVLPAEPAYAALLETLGERVEAVAKDLEVYAGDQPPVLKNIHLSIPAGSLCGIVGETGG